MATFTGSDDLRGAEFVDADLRGARFVRSDLSGVVMRGVDVQGMDIDAPWLFDGEGSLRVNGVDVVPLVEAELNRRFPGRSDRRADDPDGLRAAWASLERAWAATLERVAAMPEGTVDVSVGGEWSFAQTLRHLVMATDVWLGRAILGIEQPFHPVGQPNVEYETDGNDMSVFAAGTSVVCRGARGSVGPRRHGARLPRQRHRGGTRRCACEPVGSRARGDHPVVPPRDPWRGVGAPPLRGT